MDNEVFAYTYDIRNFDDGDEFLRYGSIVVSVDFDVPLPVFVAGDVCTPSVCGC